MTTTVQFSAPTPADPAEPLFDPSTTAIVVIDLQGWLGNNYAPYTAKEVIGRSAQLVQAFRRAGSFVALVRVTSSDFGDLPRPRLDHPLPPMTLTDGWDEIVPEIGVTATDHLVTKKQWSAFYGTDLDLQLRRRGIKTIVLCGIASGLGVDTTAREAFQLGYELVFAIDAMTGFSEAEHAHVRDVIFPRIGRIRETQAIAAVFGDAPAAPPA
ncbi:isochorismatase family protein [Paenibacillus athensensis]|uniref:Hydrolase n=1 Tax=Paenibacillus athensensis TaxID=1967502 RepID=A0A4Y8PPS0_9BACL|nr:isochorismatase family protein [Paenibacillus athensensis]MCD1259265.1 isochorismatase family protein [Paenibacillus athensensis]